MRFVLWLGAGHRGGVSVEVGEAGISDGGGDQDFCVNTSVSAGLQSEGYKFAPVIGIHDCDLAVHIGVEGRHVRRAKKRSCLTVAASNKTRPRVNVRCRLAHIPMRSSWVVAERQYSEI